MDIQAVLRPEAPEKVLAGGGGMSKLKKSTFFWFHTKDCSKGF